MERTAQPARLSPLKEGIPPEKRVFAEDLRGVFLALGVSVRRYAARRHMDPSTVTRYLGGERVPPWDFVAGVLADLREADLPVTFEAETGLRSLHGEALKCHRSDSEKQTLQDRLAEADEETRRIRTRQRALEEALMDRTQRLAEAHGRCRQLQVDLEGQRLARRSDLELWQGEFDELEDECRDLEQQVGYLREALAVARAELIAAEEQCHHLETQLEQAQDLEAQPVGRISLMALLEETDRSASVAELITVVADLESRTQRAMASELVASVSRSREVQEVAVLLAGLQSAGLHAHAEAALPALVMTRSVEETCALIVSLHHAGLEEHLVQLLRASVQLHTSRDIAVLVRSLHASGLWEQAATLLGAACATRPLPDVVPMLTWLAGTGLDGTVVSAIDAVAVERTVHDIVTLSCSLTEAGMNPVKSVLHTAAATRRSAYDVAALAEALSRAGLHGDAETVFSATQNQTIEHLLALVSALQAMDKHHVATAVINHAIASRPTADTQVLITDMHAMGRHQQASEALITALQSVPPADLSQLLYGLDRTHPGATVLLERAARTAGYKEAAAVVAGLERNGLTEHARTVFTCTVRGRPTGHAAWFLIHLNQAGSAFTGSPFLLAQAQSGPPAAMAPLVLALGAAGLHAELTCLLQALVHRDAEEIVLLLKQLERLGGANGPEREAVGNRIMTTTAAARQVPFQVVLVLALEAAGLSGNAAALVSAATASKGRSFTDALRKERFKHHQRVLSRAFWRDTEPRVE
ncbi:hypothetical protein ACIGD1_07770 [Streptomyces sp. NPDC085612]|uniref:hypothetical protein n=1 Tax=Streptomyces sp. NPDC085612 TaxID=3365732 RepID=UPI0037D808CF